MVLIYREKKSWGNFASLKDQIFSFGITAKNERSVFCLRFLLFFTSGFDTPDAALEQTVINMERHKMQTGIL